VARQRQLPTRERILLAARTLFQRRGYFAVGTAEILALARAPKGSMYHHFPRGKEQVAIEAVRAIGADVLGLLQRLEERRVCVADMVREIAKRTVRWMETSKWLEAPVLSSTAMGAVPDLPRLHAAIHGTFDQWRKQFTKLLVAEGWSRRKARSVAETVIAAIEGAIVVARIEQNGRVVRSVAEMLADLIRRNDEERPPL
jgi:TetR/AcrR family transcriptional repressor of lmrAB and yxaGH operons